MAVTIRLDMRNDQSHCPASRDKQGDGKAPAAVVR